MKSLLILMFLSLGVYAEQISYKDEYKITEHDVREQLFILRQTRSEYEEALTNVGIKEKKIKLKEEAYVQALNEYNARYELTGSSPELQFKIHELVKAWDEYIEAWDEFEEWALEVQRLGVDLIKANDEYLSSFSKLTELERDYFVSEMASK